MEGGGSKLKVQGTDSYPVNECIYIFGMQKKVLKFIYLPNILCLKPQSS